MTHLSRVTFIERLKRFGGTNVKIELFLLWALKALSVAAWRVMQLLLSLLRLKAHFSDLASFFKEQEEELRGLKDKLL